MHAKQIFPYFCTPTMHRIFTFISALLLALSSCTRVQEARQVVAEADSLRNVGVQYADTARLQKAASVLCSLTHRTEKAKALYYLGRCYSASGKDAVAADYYIAADRLRPKDPQLRGRLNANMAYICAQQNKDSLALIFYEREAAFRQQAQDTVFLSSCLFNMSLSYCELQQYNEADSVWHKAEQLAYNPYTYSRAMGVRAYYYNEIGEYDSALFCLDEVMMPDVLGRDFCNAQRAMALYYTGQVDSAVWYAQMVDDSLSSSRNRIIAYTVLREKAYKDKDIVASQKHDDKVEELQKTIDVENEQRIRAITKYEAYIQHPNSTFSRYGIICLVALCLVVLISVVIIYVVRNKRHKDIVEQNRELLHSQDEIIRQLHQSATDAQRERLLKSIDEHIDKSDLLTSLHWRDEERMLHDVNLYMFGFADRIGQLTDVSVDNIRLYVLTILDCSQKEIALYMHKSENSIKNMKARAARKLGTTSAELRQFLIDFISNPVD